MDVFGDDAAEKAVDEELVHVSTCLSLAIQPIQELTQARVFGFFGHTYKGCLDDQPSYAIYVCLYLCQFS